MKLKKSILTLALIAVAFSPLFAQEKKGGHTKSEISYYSAPVYKILDSSGAYVVIYGKAHNKIGTVTIPKEWARNRPGEVKKLTVRSLPTKLNPYITVVKRSGDFEKVILTVPSNHNNHLWGRANETKVEDVSDLESIELEV